MSNLNYFITKIQLFLILNRKGVQIAILVLVYFIFILPNLGILTSCSPVPINDEGMDACLDAQKWALDDLNKNIASKPWLTQKVQNVGAGTEGDKGTATIIRGTNAYTVQVARVADKDGTFRLITDCVKGNLKKDC
jgi:hypothetical protein